jgi:hypothetical protein
MEVNFMKWTEEQVAKLKELCREGKSNKEIAAALGCRVEDVYGKRSQLGITMAKISGAVEKKPYVKPVLTPVTDIDRDRWMKEDVLKALEKTMVVANPFIESLELTVDREHVVIRYINGSYRTACIACDSPMAVIADVVKVAMK